MAKSIDVKDEQNTVATHMHAYDKSKRLHRHGNTLTFVTGILGIKTFGEKRNGESEWPLQTEEEEQQHHHAERRRWCAVRSGRWGITAQSCTRL